MLGLETASNRDASQCKDNFTEIRPLMASMEAVVEASRCLFCFDKPCMLACPARIDVPGFIQKIRTANLQGSARIILEANILGESCARVCPAKALCEGACVMHKTGEQPIQIARLQRYAVKDVLDRQIRVLRAGRPNGKRVACIGSGPASLACAAELAKWGYAVTIFDRNELPGGNPSHSIPSYKVRTSDPLREVELVHQLGVEFRQNTEVGRDISFAELEELFDAIFIGIGLGDTSPLDLPGEDLRGVYGAKQFVRQTKMGRDKVKVGHRVAVIGAGNTAMGVLVGLKHLGVEAAYMIYRRSKEEMPAFEHEYELAKEHGVMFHWETQPVRILGKKGVVAGLECLRTRQGEPDARGRRELLPIPDSEFTLEVDMVIGAVGQKPATEFLRAVPGIQLRKDGTVLTNELHQTGNEKYFAGGDCAHGGKLVVDAVASGKAGARGLDAWLGMPRGTNAPETFGGAGAWAPVPAPSQTLELTAAS